MVTKLTNRKFLSTVCSFSFLTCHYILRQFIWSFVRSVIILEIEMIIRGNRLSSYVSCKIRNNHSKERCVFAIWFFLTKHFIRHNSLYTLTKYSQVYKEIVEIFSPCIINVKFIGNEVVKNSFYRDIFTSLIHLIPTVSSKSKSCSITA